MIDENDLKEHDYSGKCKIIIDFKSFENQVPIFKHYTFDMNFKIIKELSGAIYIADAMSVMGFIREELKLPIDATIQYKTTYIGTANDIVICLECITNKHFIRKIKIDNILND